jgi:acetyl-CoA synthetase
MTKSLWEGNDRYIETYWSSWQEIWDHGDWAQRDEDGFWFVHGRADEVMNVAGRTVGPAEVEDALLQHDAVNEAAALGVWDEITGEAIVTFVVVSPGVAQTNELKEALRHLVGEVLGKPYRPREILFIDDLPTNQSGKILRDILRHRAAEK